MKRLIAVSLLFILGLVSIGWATWDGTVKDINGNPLHQVRVTASGGTYPYVYSMFGFYSLTQAQGMQDGVYYETVYITYGQGGSTQGGTFYESQHEVKDIQEGQYYQDTK